MFDGVVQTRGFLNSEYASKS